MLDFCISNGLRIPAQSCWATLRNLPNTALWSNHPQASTGALWGSELMRWLYSPFTLLQPPQGAGPLPGDLPFGRAEAASRQHYWADSHQLTSLNEYAGYIW